MAYKQDVHLNEKLILNSKAVEIKPANQTEGLIREDTPTNHCSTLALGDYFLTLLVIGPLCIICWRGCWNISDLYIHIFPVWETLIISYILQTLSTLTRYYLLERSRRKKKTASQPILSLMKQRLFSRSYNIVFFATNVFMFRGVWLFYDQLTSHAVGEPNLVPKPFFVAVTTIIMVCLLTMLKCTRNLPATPYVIAVDSKEVTYLYRTIGKSESTREPALYVLDCLFSVVVVGSLVIFVWRGAWVLMDIYIFPEDIYKSNWASLVLGYVLAAGSFALQTPARWAAARLRGAARLALADLFLLLAFLATVNVWRSVWGLTDLYFLPESPKLSNWICFVGSYVLLVLLNCSNTLLVRGVYIDAEEPGGECVNFPCHYLRLFFHRERAKTRQRRALLLAAARKAELDSPAAHAVVPMLDSPVVDKV